MSLLPEYHLDGMGSSSDGWGGVDIADVVDQTVTVGADSCSIAAVLTGVAVSVVSIMSSSGVDVDVGTGSFTGVSVCKLTMEAGKSGPMVGSMIKNCERSKESLSPT